MATNDEIMKFSDFIEEISTTKRITIMDAVVDYCENTDFEIDVAATLLSSALKAKIHEEAMSLNMIKRAAKLPI
jgi:hypothetical protein